MAGYDPDLNLIHHSVLLGGPLNDCHTLDWILFFARLILPAKLCASHAYNLVVEVLYFILLCGVGSEGNVWPVNTHTKERIIKDE